MQFMNNYGLVHIFDEWSWWTAWTFLSHVRGLLGMVCGISLQPLDAMFLAYILSVWTGLQGKGPSSWFYGFHLCWLSKQTMLSLQTTWWVHLMFIVKSFKPFLDTWKAKYLFVTHITSFLAKVIQPQHVLTELQLNMA